MALKFLNKKGWHTGSLRNIENVWKAEQKHDAEQKKLEELRKQIQEERERHEFRLLQEQAGLTPKQERLDFLYESGLAVGKSSEGFKALQDPAPAPSSGTAAAGQSGASSSNAATPGALFEDKPQSANDAWRKLHTDPLLLIRQREQEALARIKSNPVQMARIRQTMEADKGKGKKDKHKKKHHRDKNPKHSKHSSKSKHSRGHSESGEESEEDERRKEKGGRDEHHSKSKNSSAHSDSEEDRKEREHRKEKRGRDENSYKAKHVRTQSDSEEDNEERHNRKRERVRDDHSKFERDDRSSRISSRDSEYTNFERDDRSKPLSSRDSGYTRSKDRSREDGEERQNKKRERDTELSKFEGDDPSKSSKRSSSRDYEYTGNKEKSRNYEDSRSSGKEKARDMEHARNNAEKSEREGINRFRYDNRSESRQEGKEPEERRGYGYNRRPPVPKLTEEERAARLREMQVNAELHEEQRWKRLKQASEVDAQEAVKDKASAGQRSFLDDAKKSIYGAEKGGSSTIEESVRRRSYYLQGGTAAAETNAFRR